MAIGPTTAAITENTLRRAARGIILLEPYPNTSAAMPSSEPLSTTVSTKGQVILPKAVRERLHWSAGTRLVVESTGDGVLLKAAPAFAPTRPDDVFASLPHRGAPKTLEEMELGITAEARRQHDRDRH
jgi:AbrB family looped-hinge helix DNA binding protein